MKKWMVVLISCTLLASLIMTTTVAAATPNVRLPSARVYMQADYGTTYWFDITLTGIPLGQDISNGSYHGWCVQKDMKMSDATHSVYLKSSYDFENLSVGFQSIGQENWNKINYIINHRNGVSRNNTQIAIWNITDNVDLSGYNDSKALVNAAEMYGTDYVPAIGEKLAVPLIGVTTIQLAFLELTIPGFQGLVWKDSNRDGLQYINEPGLSGVTVELFTEEGNLSQTTTTDSNGIYTFTDVPSGNYYLKFGLVSGYKFSTKDVGTNDAIDSDADTTSGETIVFSVVADETLTIWDAGMYKPDSPVTPPPPEDETPSSNVRPTADASKGEPYRGYINSNITFDGSESYDQDGRIISYHWTFGDGTNGTGEIATHIYTVPGDYNVTLSVTDDKFASDMYPTTAHITAGNNPPATPTLSGPTFGHADISYQFTVLSSDPDGDTLYYSINWGDGSHDISTVVDSGQSYQFTHHWTTPGFYMIQAYANDTTQTDDNKSNIGHMTIAIDVQYVGDHGYLIDENGDGTFDQFHNNATSTQTTVQQQDTGGYLIDSNDDGTYDLLYDTSNGSTQPYTEQPLLIYLVIILVILIIVGLFVFYMMRKRRKP
jgi:hypothetical protein